MDRMTDLGSHSVLQRERERERELFFSWLTQSARQTQQIQPACSRLQCLETTKGAGLLNHNQPE